MLLRHSIGLLLSITLWLAVCAVEDSDAEEDDLPGLQLNFQETPWSEVLEQLAEHAGLSLQMEFDPPGRFSYHDPRTFTTKKALDLVHGVLLDRGITLIQRDRLLLVIRLADQLHWGLVPHVPQDRLESLPPNQIVFTTFPVHSLLVESAVGELEPMLSPRGRIVGIGSARRIAVWDRAGVLRKLRKLLEEIDPETEGKGTSLRVFMLRHANVQRVMPIVRDLIGSPPSGSSDRYRIGGINFEKMGRQLGDSKMLDAFVPGFSLPGIVPDPARQQRTTRISMDVVHNALLITAEPDILALVAQVIHELDVPEPESQARTWMVSRSYRVSTTNAEELAQRIRQVCTGMEGITVSSTSSLVLVRAPKAKQEQIANMLRDCESQRPRTAVLPVADGKSEKLAELLRRLFRNSSEDTPPVFVAKPESNLLLVRGSSDQIEQVRQALEGMITTRP